MPAWSTEARDEVQPPTKKLYAKEQFVGHVDDRQRPRHEAASCSLVKSFFVLRVKGTTQAGRVEGVFGRQGTGMKTLSPVCDKKYPHLERDRYVERAGSEQGRAVAEYGTRRTPK